MRDKHKVDYTILIEVNIDIFIEKLWQNNFSN